MEEKKFERQMKAQNIKCLAVPCQPDVDVGIRNVKLLFIPLSLFIQLQTKFHF